MKSKLKRQVLPILCILCMVAAVVWGALWSLALPAGLVIWRLLGRTGLGEAPRVLLTVLAALAVGALLFWVGLYLSIFLFQLRDRPTW